MDGSAVPFRIYLSPPYMCGREMEYIQDAFDTNWIAPTGPAITAFEKETAAYLGVEAALALSSGTAAIHLALRWLGVDEGDLVFCQDFTFIGSCAPVLYQKAQPVMIDSEPDSWNMSPAALERALNWAKRTNRLPKAVIVCDLYGEPANWDEILPLCRAYGVPVIEDAAEAIGATYRGRPCATFGEIGVLSFNGNKIITSSGGGMAVSRNAKAVQKMGFWATQAREPFVHYEHTEFGYNYRMSNISACIGRGQLTILTEKLLRRRRNYEAYAALFQGSPAHVKPMTANCESNHWLTLLVIDAPAVTPQDVVAALHGAGIEGRPAWKPMHLQPVFANAPFVTADAVYEDGNGAQEDGVSGGVFRRAVCLPSGDALTGEQLAEIAEVVKGRF